MKIILLEFVDEAENFIAEYGLDFLKSPDVKIIALHPKVIAFLKGHGIESLSTIPFLNNDAQHRIILKSEEFTFRILEDLKFQDALGLTQGYREFCLHHLRLHFNHYLWVIEILQGAAKQYQIDAIYASLPKNEEVMYTSKGYINDDERFVGLLAREFCQKINIAFHSIEFQKSKRSFKDDILRLVARQCGRVLMGMQYLCLSFRKYKDQKTIVVPAPSYRMDLLLKDIKNLHPTAKTIMLWEGQDSAKQEMYKVYLTLTNFWKKLKKEEVFDLIIHLDLIKNLIPKDKETQHKFTAIIDQAVRRIKESPKEQWLYTGIDVSKIAGSKIERGLRAELLKFEHSNRCLAKVLKKISPKLLMSMYSGNIYFMMGELSEKLGYIALNISHGTHVPPNNEYEKIENIRLAVSVISNTYPYVSVQTPWTNKFLDYYKDTRKRIMTGPLLFSVTNKDDRQKLRSEVLGTDQANKKIVIHATTQKGRQSLRFHITETLDEYISAVSDITNVINQLENTYLIIRPHPVFKLTEREFRELLPQSSRLRFINSGPFSRVLSASDLVISYSSTCIEEAMQNNIPVILYDKWKRYNHFNIQTASDSKDTISNCVTYATETAVLKDQIVRILSNSWESEKLAKLFKEYQYPKEYRNNFFNFVNKVLTSKN